MHREEADLVYRGEIIVTLRTRVNSTPASPHPNTRPTTLEPSAANALEHFSSPLTPLAPSRAPSPGVGYRALVTYASRDRRRFQAQDRHREQERAARKAAERRTTKKCAHRGPPRCSKRLQCTNPVAAWDVATLLNLGHVVYEHQPDTLMPMIDMKGFLMAAIAGAPKGQSPLWALHIKEASQVMRHLDRNGEFSPSLDSQELRVRFGLAYGEFGAKPHRIWEKSVNLKEIAYIRHADAFRAICGYQNHLFQQIAPAAFMYCLDKVSKLKEMCNLVPPFPKSVFTTSEVIACGMPNLSREIYDAAMFSMVAFATGGNYTKGGVIFWDDNTMIPLLPGETVLFWGPTKRYSFLPVAPNERMYVFKQSVNVGIVRWIERGGRSDVQFEESATDAEQTNWQTICNRRGDVRRYGKLQDIFVF
ncbi:hypothetical protein DFH07DRAFT_964530 [Mycena maculata]|uniref:Uncharacterized protein n=1 Tax=Mycena maculata TaxID=230809 RepID=A0AAD7IGB9_9AGAR|nr:hypothetical protein DFH07DRAFT_964530 [Mycena maculata]